MILTSYQCFVTLQAFGDVSATPVVVDGVVYIVDWGFPNYLIEITRLAPFFTGNGHVTAVEADSGI